MIAYVDKLVFFFSQQQIDKEKITPAPVIW